MNLSEHFIKQCQKLLSDFAQEVIELTYDELINLKVITPTINDEDDNLSKPLDLTVKRITKENIAESQIEKPLLQQSELCASRQNDYSFSLPAICPTSTAHPEANQPNDATSTEKASLLANTISEVLSNVSSNLDNLLGNISDLDNSSELSSLPSAEALANTKIPVLCADGALQQAAISQLLENARHNLPLKVILNNDNSTTKRLVHTSNDQTDQTDKENCCSPAKKQKISNSLPEVMPTVSFQPGQPPLKSTSEVVQPANTTRQKITFDQSEPFTGDLCENSEKEPWSNDQFSDIKVLAIKCSEDSCSQMFDNKTDFDEHISTVHSLKPFLCLVDKCNQEYSNIKVLFCHILTSHKVGSNWKCRLCHKQYNKPEYHFNHYQREHQQGTFQCELCKDFTGNLRADVEQHIKTEHLKSFSEKNNSKSELVQLLSTRSQNHIESLCSTKVVSTVINCPVKACSKQFISESKQADLNNHIKEQHHLKEFKCLFNGCKRSYRKRQDLEHHVEDFHAFVSQWRCRNCPNKFGILSHSELVIHTKLEHHQGVFACAGQECTFKADTRQQVIEHYNLVHLIEPGINVSAMIDADFDA